MDRETIEFNYSITIKQAEDVERLASSVDCMADNEIVICVQNISTRWKGDNSVKFISKISTVVDNTENLSSNLISISAAIRNAEEAIREAGLEALRIEEERAYLARLEEERLLREKEKSSKVKRVIKKSKGIIAILIILFSLSGTLSGCVSNEKDSYSTPIEMTEKEKDLMRNSWSSDDFEKGVLSPYQEKDLYYLRKMMMHLQQKYPSYELEIVRFNPNLQMNYYDFDIEYQGKRYEAKISFQSNHDPYYTDNFYSYLFGEEYNKWIEELLVDKGYSVKVYTRFFAYLGDDINEQSTLNDLISLHPKMTKQTFIYLPGEENQEDSKTIEEAIFEYGIYGAYELFFTNNDENLTVYTVEDNRRRYPQYNFTCFDVDTGDKTNVNE